MAPTNFFLLTLQHQTAVISRPSSRSPCFLLGLAIFCVVYVCLFVCVVFMYGMCLYILIEVFPFSNLKENGILKYINPPPDRGADIPQWLYLSCLLDITRQNAVFYFQSARLMTFILNSYFRFDE